MSELIVDDGFILNSGTRYKQCGENLQSMIDQYLEKLALIRQEAVIDGTFAGVLDAFTEYANGIKDSVQEFGKEIDDLCVRYQSAIDKADEAIY